MDSGSSEQETNPMIKKESEAQLANGREPNSGKVTLPLLMAASAAVFGSSFQFGYNTGVINAPGAIIKNFFNQTYFERHGKYIESISLDLIWGFAVSIFAIGGMIGSFVAGYLASRFGRKKAMLGNNIFALIGAALMGCSKLANSYEMLIVGRLVIGFNCGINTGLAPLYLTEIAPVRLRGIFGTMNQLGIVTSMLLSQILGISQILGTESGWPILLALTAVFAVYQLILLPFCPESPQYLLLQMREDEAKESLLFLRGKYVDVGPEIEQLCSDQDEARSERKVPIHEIFKTSYLREPMIIAIVMQLSQQLSGINAVFYYSTDLFQSAGVDKSDLVTVGMGVANIVMTLVSLLLIERLGRRVLHLVGLGGMFLSSLVLVVSLTAGQNTGWGPLLSVIFVMLFVISFQTGPGSIPWFITAELFSQGARSSAISVAGLVNWTGNFIVGIGYPPLESVIHGYTFIIFAVLLAGFWIFTFLKVPETKGRSIEEITSSFKKD